MRKYLSLGAAMMMGTVIGKTEKKETTKYELQPPQVLGMPSEHVQAAYKFEHAQPIPTVQHQQRN